MAYVGLGAWFLVVTSSAASSHADSGETDALLHSKRTQCHSHSWEWGLAFHMQTVNVPLAVLAFTVFGSRLWPDVLTHLVFLSAAVNLLWAQLQLHQERGGLWLARVVMLLLTTTCLYAVHVQVGPFDTWRYAVCFIIGVGLLPLYVLSLVPAFATQTSLRAYHSLSLMAGNAALLACIVSLGSLF